jgi:hypothetical protein
MPKLRQKTDAGGAPEASISTVDRNRRFEKFVEKTDVENFSIVERKLALLPGMQVVNSWNSKFDFD